MGPFAEAAKSLQTAIDLIKPMAEAPGASTVLQTELAIHSVNLGDVFNYQRDFKKALEYHRLGADTMRRILPKDGQAVTPRRRLALMLARVGADLIDLSQYEEGIAATQETIAVYRRS